MAALSPDLEKFSGVSYSEQETQLILVCPPPKKDCAVHRISCDCTPCLEISPPSLLSYAFLAFFKVLPSPSVSGPMSLGRGRGLALR